MHGMVRGRVLLMLQAGADLCRCAQCAWIVCASACNGGSVHILPSAVHVARRFRRLCAVRQLDAVSCRCRRSHVQRPRHLRLWRVVRRHRPHVSLHRSSITHVRRVCRGGFISACSSGFSGVYCNVSTSCATCFGVFSFGASPVVVTEEGGPLVLAVWRHDGVAGAATVTLSLDTGASNATAADFATALPLVVSFAAGVARVNVTVLLNDDAVDEVWRASDCVSFFGRLTPCVLRSSQGCEAAVFQLGSPTGGAAVTSSPLSTTTVVMDDSDAVAVTQFTTSVGVLLSPSTASVTVRPGGVLTMPLTVTMPSTVVSPSTRPLEVLLIVDGSSSAAALRAAVIATYPAVLAQLYGMSSALKVGLVRFVDQPSTGASAVPYVVESALTTDFASIGTRIAAFSSTVNSDEKTESVLSALAAACVDTAAVVSVAVQPACSMTASTTAFLVSSLLGPRPLLGRAGVPTPSAWPSC